MKTFEKSMITTALAALTTSAAQAISPSSFSYEGDLTAIVQASDQKKLNTGTEASGDFFIHYQKSHWQINLHLEGNITPSSNSITAQLPDANADAFSAMDQYENGRLQISELSADYTDKQATMSQISFGLLDATTFFDTNAIMNDENTQFISAPLGNNPTIDFPDYTLGITATFQVGLKPNLQTQLGVFSGKGLADNAGRNYNETFELNPDKKGMLIIGETQLMKTPIHHLSFGAWTHTGEHSDLEQPSRNKLINYGLYLTGSHQMGANTMAIRLGYSRPEINELNKVLSLGIQHVYNTQWVTGAAGSYQSASSHTQIDDTQTFEFYVRYQPSKSDFFITPSIQYFHNANIAKNITLGNLRLSYLF